jgi:hypothetical protein
VRQAVGILGHRVDITSAPSQGSRFSIFATKAEKIAEQSHRAERSWETTSGAQP